MTRISAVSTFFVLVLILAMAVAPLASAVAQSGPVTDTIHGVYNQIPVGVAIPGILACEGCSGGGGGPG